MRVSLLHLFLALIWRSNCFAVRFLLHIGVPQWKTKYPASRRFSPAWLLLLTKSFTWLVSHIVGLHYTPLWNWDLWKSHENNLKITWTSFHGQWILQNNFSWSHLWPLNFRGKKVKRVSCEWNTILNWTTFMGHEFPMKHHIMATFQESSMMEPSKTLNGSWNKYRIWFESQ